MFNKIMKINENRFLVIMLPVLMFGTSVQAQEMSLSNLPTGCSYTSNSQNIFNSTVTIPAATPNWAEIGEAPQVIMSLGIKCGSSVTAPVIAQIKESGSLNWIGPGRDILATNISGVGVRLFSETQSQGGQCTGAGVLSSRNYTRCILAPEKSEQRHFNIVIKAQLIKIGNNTPLMLQSVLETESGGTLLLNLQSNTQASVNIVNNGLISPTVITEASCMLITDQNQNVNFGTVNLAKSSTELTLGQPQAMRIGVACSPRRDESVNPYGVDITFNAGKMISSDISALSTSMDNLIIRYASEATPKEWLDYGKKIPLNYNSSASSDKSHFEKTFYWFLRYLPEVKAQSAGEFNAIATYTITVQ